MLNQEQVSILQHHQLKKIQPLIEKLVNQQIFLKDLSDRQLLEVTQAANFCYRAGYPFIEDQIYDHIWLKTLNERNIQSQFLKKIEPEGQVVSDNMVKLPQRMFSLEKAYDIEQIQRFINRIEKKKIALKINETLIYTLSPKLDGFAAFDDGDALYTRGNGEYGINITRVFDRGLRVYKNDSRGLGLGEIVTETNFFEQHLKQFFSHPRNFTASILREKDMDPLAKKAIKEQKSVFVPFDLLPQKDVQSDDLIDLQKLSNHLKNMSQSIPFLTDGLVISVSKKHQKLRKALAYTEKHARFQIAYKQNAIPLKTEVLDIQYQVSKQGRITPVIIFKPIDTQGATLSKCTAHHCGMLKNGLGRGAKIEVIRSGEVIPKLVNILDAKASEAPKTCPSCQSSLKWIGDFLYCQNEQCLSQQVERMFYFFEKINFIKGFGRATLNIFCQNQINTIEKVYALDFKALKNMQFGDKISQNLLENIDNSKKNPIEDYQFLAAFGLANLGISSCRKLLSNQNLSELLQIDEQAIAAHKGFAQITAHEIFTQLQKHANEIEWVSQNFQIIETFKINTHIADQKDLTHVVLTGIFSQPRALIEKKLGLHGFISQKQVNKKTKFLIVGDTPGDRKVQKAKQLNIEMIEHYVFQSKYLQNT